MKRYSDIAFSESARRRQRVAGSYEHYAAPWPAPAALGDEEIAFLAERDSIYLASTGENGWPYVQHRGGPAGFIRVAGPTRLAWADRPGNGQFVSAGNLDHDDRVSIIAVDYPNRRRLKLYGHATFDASPDPEELDRLGIDRAMEGLVTIEVVAFDWNCPRFITPRYTAKQVKAVTAPLEARIRELEAERAGRSSRFQTQ